MSKKLCRLCSAECSLISLFSIKNRKYRDIIRKLISETVNIKIEKGGSYSTVCYNCVAHVYNFHIFRVRSQQNERSVQESENDGTDIVQDKGAIIPLENLNLPSIEELKDGFTPWLLKKHKTVKELEVHHISDSVTSDESNFQLNSTKISTDVKATQTTFFYKDKSTQCNTYSTTAMPATYTQNVQCHFQESLNESNIEYNGQSNSSLLDYNQMEKLKFKNINKEKEVSTDKNKMKVTRSLGIQCELIPPAIQSRHAGVQVNVPVSIIDKCVQIDLCVSNLKSFKEDVDKAKDEQQSPIYPPIESLTASVVFPCKAEGNISTTSCTSKSKNSPLTLKTAAKMFSKLLYCRECKYAGYSRMELQKHMRIHMRCKLCKQMFKSVKETKAHFLNKCDIKLTKMQLVVKVERVSLKNHLQTCERVLNKEHISVTDSVCMPQRKKIRLDSK